MAIPLNLEYRVNANIVTNTALKIEEFCKLSAHQAVDTAIAALRLFAHERYENPTNANDVFGWLRTTPHFQALVNFYRELGGAAGGEDWYQPAFVPNINNIFVASASALMQAMPQQHATTSKHTYSLSKAGLQLFSQSQKNKTLDSFVKALLREAKAKPATYNIELPCPDPSPTAKKLIGILKDIDLTRMIRFQFVEGIATY